MLKMTSTALLLLLLSTLASATAHEKQDQPIPIGFVEAFQTPANGMKVFHIQRPRQSSADRIRIQSVDGTPLVGTLSVEDDYYGIRTFDLGGGTTFQTSLFFANLTDEFKVHVNPQRATTARIAVNSYSSVYLPNHEPWVIRDLLDARFTMPARSAPATVSTRGGNGNVVLRVMTPVGESGPGQQVVCESKGGGTVHRCTVTAPMFYDVRVEGDVEGVEVRADW